jgi:type I restriction enzyme S subunit
MEDWKLVRAADFIDFNPRESVAKGAMAKKVGMEHLQPFTRDIPAFEVAPFNGGSKFRNGDTLMARITPCLENGKTAQVAILDDGEVGFGSTEFIVLRAKPGVSDKDFVYYLAMSPLLRDKAIKSMVGSSGRQRVQQGVLDNTEFLAPPLAEQIEIGRTLRALDDKIANNTKINNHLEQMAQAIFKSWFVDFEPFADGEFIESELGEIPAGWSVQTIEYLAEKVAMGPFGSNIKVETFVDSGVPIISGNHLRGLYLDELSYNFITEEHARRLSNSLVRAGDIIFTHAGNIGQVAMIPDDCAYPYYVISQRQFYLRCDKTKALPEYINYFFHSREGQGKLLANASQTGVPSIARPSSHLKGISVVLPPIEVQLKWFEMVEAMVQTLNSNNKESKRLASIRDSLLPRLMSGELSVADVDAK